MNRVEQLSRKLQAKLSQATVTLDRPERPSGSWWLDAALGKNRVTVEWRPALGFGVSTPSDTYGEGPDEFHPDVDDAFARVVALLEGGGRTRPLEAGALRRLRESRGVTQVELAALMGIRQATVSKMENRGEMNLDTLRRLVMALGGTLEIKAQFPDGAIAIDLGVKAGS